MCWNRVKLCVGVWWGLVVALRVEGYVETGQYISDLDQPVPIASVHGVLGKKAALPCDIQSLDSEDHVSMVLWFKEFDGEPLYSYDVRGRLASQPKLWSSPSGFGSRAFFRAAAAPAVLLVDAVMPSDAGVYRCRVDFRNAPTRNMKLNFTVIVPPNRPNILDARSRNQTRLLEPYNEGETLDLVCEVYGGDPRPRVTWYLENVVIDDSFEQRADGVTLNTLTFPNVGRQHLNARLVCQASNTNLAPPQNKVLILDINLRPLTVNIISKPRQLSADRSYEVECRSAGSRPEGLITWWKGNRQLKRGVKNFSESNSSLSSLTLLPEAEDHGRQLVCRVQNPRIPDSTLEDKWTLNVHYLPAVTLKMGSSLNPELIKEGDDVYFECSVNSNPRNHKLIWYKGNKEIQHSQSSGTLVSEASLVLQSVTRAAAGEYRCAAHNSEGTGTSNPVTLIIRYAPICKSSEGTVYGALKHERVQLQCAVHSSPPPTGFIWIFNSSGEQNELPPSSYTSSEFTSTLSYTPSRDVEFGVISCVAHNLVGEQAAPCLYRLVAASPPTPPQNCSVVKQVSPELQVSCSEGFDGGLPQHFIMEVLELPYLLVRYNVSSSNTPFFNVSSLDSRVSYALRIYSANAKGRSDAVELYTVSTRSPDKYTDSSSSLPLPLWGLQASAAAAGGGALLGAALCALCAARRRAASRAEQREQGKHNTKGDSLYVQNVESLSVKQDNSYTLSPNLEYSGLHLEKDLRSIAPEIEDNEPDIIPGNYDKLPPASEYMKLRRSTCEEMKPSNMYRETQDNLSAANSRLVSRGVTARTVDIFTASRPRLEVVTTARKVKESCI